MSTETITTLETTPFVDNEFAQRLTDKTVLITGAGGYLGTALLSSLYTVRCRLIALVRDVERVHARRETEATLELRRADLAHGSVWLDVLRETRPDVIVNLAAHEHRRNSPHSPAEDLAVNAATVLELLEACVTLDLKPRIVLASSANIAGCPGTVTVNEDTPDRPLTLFAIHKLAAEHYLSYYASRFDVPGISLRFANIYGPLPTRNAKIESRVILNNLMRRALAGGPLYLYRNQNCVRDFVYIDDAVRAICAAATAETIDGGSKYIVGSGEGHTLRETLHEIAGQVQELRGVRVEIHSDDAATLEPIEWRNFIADYSRLRVATGWTPRTKLFRGIDLTLRAFEGGQSH
jgi:nucleoside-diphosphate-sugar epimerase